MSNMKSVSFWTILSIAFFAATAIALTLANAPFIAANLGVSSATAYNMANALNNISNVATALTIIGTFTGVGTVGSGVAATILAILKKKGVAKAAAF